MINPASRKLLITGAFGYLGGRIASYLSGAEPTLAIKLMMHREVDVVPLWAKPMDIVRADLLDEETLTPALSDVDTVLHLAALNEIDSQRDPELALQVNGTGTYRLLQAAQYHGVRRFIYMSTFHVYGPKATQPITEDTIARPVHPYAITHKVAEDFVNWFGDTTGMETLILRLSNGYGYPAHPDVERWSLVFNDLCKQAVNTGEIKLRSSGVQQRDFISLTDICRGIQHFLRLPSHGWQDGLFNFGGACSMSIIDVARFVAEQFKDYTGKQAIITTGEPENNPNSNPVEYSIEKLTLSGFSLTSNMAVEVRETFKVCQQRRNTAGAP